MFRMSLGLWRMSSEAIEWYSVSDYDTSKKSQRAVAGC